MNSIGKENLIIYVSSKNNYDMLEKEVLSNINFEGFEFINVDDNSSVKEIEKGKDICKKNKIVFLQNRKNGVQHATNTLIEFIKENRKNCKWIICFQHDNYPLTKGFFKKISKYIGIGKINKYGIIGFNHLDFWDYTIFAYLKYKIGFKPLGAIGMPHLSYNSNKKWLCPKQYYFQLLFNKKFKNPFIIEFPVWPSVGINVEKWIKNVKPSEEYQFHLWLPDVSMQFLNKGIYSIIIPDLYCLNNQKLKEKYNINSNSAIGAKEGNEYHFGKYIGHEHWKKKWGWDPDNPRGTFQKPSVSKNFDRFFDHNIINGPIKNIKLD